MMSKSTKRRYLKEIEILKRDNKNNNEIKVLGECLRLGITETDLSKRDKSGLINNTIEKTEKADLSKRKFWNKDWHDWSIFILNFIVVLLGTFIFLSIQASWPLFQPRIQMDYSITYGIYNVSAGAQYAGQEATVTVTPPLINWFPKNSYVIAYELKNLKELESNPLMRIYKASESEMGIDVNASGFQWSKISEKIYLYSDKQLNHVSIYGEEIDDLSVQKSLEKTESDYVYRYGDLRLSNREDFYVQFLNIRLKIHNNTEAWNKIKDWVVKGRGIVRAYYSDTWDYTKGRSLGYIVYGNKTYTEINSSTFNFSSFDIEIDQSLESDIEKNPIIFFIRYSMKDLGLPHEPKPFFGKVTVHGKKASKANVNITNIITNEKKIITTSENGYFLFELADFPTYIEIGDELKILICYEDSCYIREYIYERYESSIEFNIDI